MRLWVELAFARLSYWFFLVFAKGGLGIIYVPLVAEGMRLGAPILGKKFHQLPLPWIGQLKNYEGWNKLDAAPILALILFVIVMGLWQTVIAQWLGYDRDANDIAVNEENEWTLLHLLGYGLLGADAILFYWSMGKMTWGGSYLSLSALIVTVIYLLVIVSVSYMLVKMHRRLDRFTKENSNESHEKAIRGDNGVWTVDTSGVPASSRS